MTLRNEIDLANLGGGLAEPVETVRKLFQEMHAGAGPGFPSRWDYARFSVAYERVQGGGSVLDVGVGSGQLINALALGGAFGRVCGIDVREHSKFTRFVDGFELRLMSVAEMEFGDHDFDTVICMEVLEHLDPSILDDAIAELRRVCAQRLLMTVPYDEPEPLPRYHRSRFEDEDMRRLFPDAALTLLRKPGVPWMMIEEHGAA